MTTAYDPYQDLPTDTREIELEPETSKYSSVDIIEYETENFTNSYLEVDDFNNMLGYTLEDVCEWLDDRYKADFQSTSIDSFDYGDGWILLSREKVEE